MNKQSSFYRKMIYLCLIIALLFPLAWLARPATVTDELGGQLSKMRVENGLSQANLGEIDPASETMKLATLGLRGVAVNLLWGQAEEYKKKEDWTNLTATLEQLALLQPNFITFWKYQSWNVSYNVSVQFDDYRDRYYYVREGIEFLKEGVKKNQENRDIPQLLWDLGWFIGQKIGRADEYVQYRDLFKKDDQFHGEDVPPGSDERDNWWVSKVEYLNGINAINRGKSIGKKSDKIYYSSPAKSQMNYAEAIEEEGAFEKAQAAWKVAADDWRDFGDMVIEHSTGRKLRLGHEAELAEIVKKLEADLEGLGPGVREQMVEEKRAKLSDEQRAALDKPMAERNEAEYNLASQAEMAIEVTDAEFIDRIAKDNPELRKQAGILARQLADERTNLIFTERYKSDANFDYWALRAEFEQTDTAVEARRKMFEAKKAFQDRQAAEEAKELYEQGFAKWRELVDQYPALLDTDGVTGDDILVFIVDYRTVLRSLGETIPEDFVLWEVIENFDSEMKFEEEIRIHQEAKGQAAPAEGEAADSGTEPAGEPETAELTEEPADDDAATTETPAAEPAAEPDPS
ncbi:hypothetical protein [Aeoliella sp. SH292]|uniref:hypothetical protein n=1 Tax=Aeoliella sp. SH292 TaxID=3454464 RepID=UPI003F978A08